MGVFLENDALIYPTEGLPHARGGVSPAIRIYDATDESSPRTWGCFSSPVSPTLPRKVFPTHVGVFPTRMNIMEIQ